MGGGGGGVGLTSTGGGGSLGVEYLLFVCRFQNGGNMSFSSI